MPKIMFEIVMEDNAINAMIDNPMLLGKQIERGAFELIESIKRRHKQVTGKDFKLKNSGLLFNHLSTLYDKLMVDCKLIDIEVPKT